MTSPACTTPVLSEADFDRLSTLIRRESGIRLTGAKKSRREGRLLQRARALPAGHGAERIRLVGGFPGHSESITDMQVPLKQIKPTVFRRM
jgi:hypothetical protein